MPIPPALPRIAVLMAVYNGMEFLPAQLDSILNQHGVDIHVWVSVDLSTDGSENWLNSKAQEDPRITVLPTGMQFGRAALNFFRLLREVPLQSSDYVALADQDDIWETDKLLRAHTILNANGSDGYSSNVTAFWPNGKECVITKSQAQRQWDFLFEAPGPGCTFVMRHTLCMNIQQWLIQAPQSILHQADFHDWLIYAYARSHGYRWQIDAYSSMRYRQHGNNQLGANTNLKSIWRRAVMVLQGHWLQQAQIIAVLIGWQNHPVVRNWLDGKRLGFFKLATRFLECRRRRRDQFLFALACLWMAVKPTKADTACANQQTP